MAKRNGSVPAFLILVCCLQSLATLAQTPEWSFHVAFEDATGSQDTVWLVWDSTATDFFDPQLGDSAYQLQGSDFQVFFIDGNNAADTTKVIARSPFYNSISGEISAVNYVLPIKMTWDTTLYHIATNPKEINSGSLNGSYWFFHNSQWNPTPYDLHQYDLMTTDTATIYEQTLNTIYFPFTMLLRHWTFVPGVESIDEQLWFTVHPNPADDMLHIDCATNNAENEYWITTIDGRFVRTGVAYSNSFNISVQDLPAGLYTVTIQNSDSKQSTLITIR